MVGRTVTIKTPTINLDAEHDSVRTYSTIEVDNVLIAPGNTVDVNSNDHYSGVKIDYTLAFPKTFSGSLRGCEITLPAPWNYTGRVVGDPQPNDPDNCPTDWYLTVLLEACDG